jgi:hypothetical protein
MRGVGQVHMPGVELIPGTYREGGGDYEFVQSTLSGHCYEVNDGVPNLDWPHEGLHNMLQSVHPGVTASGKPKGFSTKGKMRILGVLLKDWDARGEPALLLFFLSSRVDTS